MQASGGTIVVNPSFQDWCYEDEKYGGQLAPVRRQITYHVEEEIGHRPYDLWTHDTRDSRRARAEFSRSNNCIELILMTGVCLISMAALALTILLLIGKIGDKCGCPKNEGKIQHNSYIFCNFISNLSSMEYLLTVFSFSVNMHFVKYRVSKSFRTTGQYIWLYYYFPFFIIQKHASFIFLLDHAIIFSLFLLSQVSWRRNHMKE